MSQRSGFRSLAFTGALVLLALISGAYVSMQYWQSRLARQASDDAIIRIANDLEIVKRIRDGNTKGAVELIGVDTEISLLYLVRNDEVASKNEDFIRRRSVVLTRLRDEWAKNPRYQALSADQRTDNGSMAEEKQKYYQELQAYLDSHAKSRPAGP